MRDHYIPDGVVCIENDTIVKVGTKKETMPCEASEIIDAKGLFVGPGFVDIHTHAGGDADFMKDPCRAAKNHLIKGTTSVMPALYFDMNTEQYVEAIKLMKNAMSAENSNIPGIYMEGPLLNCKFGADRTAVPWKGVAYKNEYMPIIEEAWDVAKVWALAPETENILEFVKDVKSKNPNAVFSVAHSEASPQQIEAIMPYGLKIGTHHTNATGDRPRYPECRGVCVDEAVNYNREIYAELICDSLGIHVDPYMLRLVRRIKGDDRIILISDACTPQGPIPEGYEGVTDINFDFVVTSRCIGWHLVFYNSE
jgi:N-acetylglucosamine-6-phosphate deacetylase